MTGQGRPALRLAAWRAVWGALKFNPVYAARLAHLTGREHNKLSTGQAHAALAAALLRHLHAVITTGQRRHRHRTADNQPYGEGARYPCPSRLLVRELGRPAMRSADRPVRAR